jgi:isoquinoline 1-oxidoreductase beta subunit
MTDNSRMTRRHFLVSVAAVGGGLVLGVALPKVGRAAGEIETGSHEVNAWVIVQPDNTVIIRVARSEMGQGILTALPMLVAEELACDWTKVRAEYAAPEENLRRNRVFGPMLTGGSRSVRESQEYLRQAGADRPRDAHCRGRGALGGPCRGMHCRAGRDHAQTIRPDRHLR